VNLSRDSRPTVEVQAYWPLHIAKHSAVEQYPRSTFTIYLVLQSCVVADIEVRAGFFVIAIWNGLAKKVLTGKDQQEQD